MRTCRLCGVEKPEEAYQLRKDSGRRRTECQTCRGKQSLDRYHAALENRIPHYRAARKSALMKRYGMRLEDFEKLHAARHGLCDICSRPNIAGRVLVVDHCHTTGKARGLICHPCNHALGSLQEDPAIIRRLLSYVENKGLEDDIRLVPQFTTAPGKTAGLGHGDKRPPAS
jgi:hypothetical protein